MSQSNKKQETPGYVLMKEQIVEVVKGLGIKYSDVIVDDDESWKGICVTFPGFPGDVLKAYIQISRTEITYRHFCKVIIGNYTYNQKTKAELRHKLEEIIRETAGLTYEQCIQALYKRHDYVEEAERVAMKTLISEMHEEKSRIEHLRAEEHYRELLLKRRKKEQERKELIEQYVSENLTIDVNAKTKGLLIHKNMATWFRNLSSDYPPTRVDLIDYLKDVHGCTYSNGIISGVAIAAKSNTESEEVAENIHVSSLANEKEIATVSQ